MQHLTTAASHHVSINRRVHQFTDTRRLCRDPLVSINLNNEIIAAAGRQENKRHNEGWNLFLIDKTKESAPLQVSCHVVWREKKKVKLMEEKLESIAKLAQDYLHKVPLIILGCGASAPLGIPPMVPLGEYVLATLEPLFNTESYWKPFSDAMLATRNLEKVLFENPYPQVFNDAVVRATWDLITEADLALFCECVSKKRELPLTPIFTKLLQSHPRKIRVVTTNYDRIAEYSSNSAGARFSTGFTGEYIGKFEPEENHFHHSTKCVDICKVHGSLDWFIDSNNIAFSIPPATSIPENSTPLIVTPGLQKFRETHKDPYRSTIGKADKFISDAACFLAIGYGFNDEHIQPALIEQINRKKKPIVIVTKELTAEGAKILAATGVSKYLVFSEGTKPEHTKVTTSSGVEEIENIALWQVPEFTKIWIG